MRPCRVMRLGRGRAYDRADLDGPMFDGCQASLDETNVHAGIRQISLIEKLLINCPLRIRNAF